MLELSRLAWFPAAVCIFVGCARDNGAEQGAARVNRPKPAPKNLSELKIGALNAEDRARLTKQRLVIERFLRDDESREKFKTAQGKLDLLRELLDVGVYGRNQPYELQCLGVVLGDVFVLNQGMEWITFEDESGRDLAVRVPDRRIYLLPLTMISKRIERREKFNLVELYEGAVAQVEKMKQSDEY